MALFLLSPHWFISVSGLHSPSSHSFILLVAFLTDSSLRYYPLVGLSRCQCSRIYTALRDLAYRRACITTFFFTSHSAHAGAHAKWKSPAHRRSSVKTRLGFFVNSRIAQFLAHRATPSHGGRSRPPRSGSQSATGCATEGRTGTARA